MGIIKNAFFKQVSLATLRKELKSTNITQIDFWEAEVLFSHNKSDFDFSVIVPEKNSLIKEYKSDKLSYSEKFDKALNRRGKVKRFRSEEDANNYILFNMIQIYKPLKNYIDENDIIEKFNNLILDHPEKFISELDKGSNWLVN